MAITIDEMNDLQLYKQGIYMPVNDNDRKNGSLMYLMAPSLRDSKSLLNEMYVYGSAHNTFVGLNNWISYYMEKDVTFYLNHEQHTLSLKDDQLLLEDGEVVSKFEIVKVTIDDNNTITIYDKGYLLDNRSDVEIVGDYKNAYLHSYDASEHYYELKSSDNLTFKHVFNNIDNKYYYVSSELYK